MVRLVGGGAARALLTLMVGALVALALMTLAPHAQALGGMGPYHPNCAAPRQPFGPTGVTATLSIGTPKTTVSSVTYVTSATVFTLSGSTTGCIPVSSVSYRVYLVGGTAPSYTTTSGNSKTFSLTSLSDGNYQIDYYASATPTAGVRGGTNPGGVPPTPTTAYVTLDNTAPTTTATFGTPKYMPSTTLYVTPSTSLELDATDAGSGVASINYRVYLTSGTAPSYTTVSAATATPSLASLSDGAYTLDDYATDALGNAESMKTVSFTVVSVTSSSLSLGSPSVTISTVTYVTSATPITISGTDTGAGVASVSYRVYAKNATPGSYTTVSGSSTQITLTSLADGYYEVQYYATDQLGNALPTHTQEVSLDDALPTVTLTVGTPSTVSYGHTVVTAATSFSVAGTDTTVGVSSVSYRIYPANTVIGLIPAFTPVSGASTSFSLTGSDGYYRVDAITTNALGAISSIATTLVNLRTTTPVTTLTLSGVHATITSVTYINAKTIVRLAATGPIQVQTVSYRVYLDQSTAPDFTAVSGKSAKFTLGTLADGTYDIDYFASDALGNIETTNSVKLVLDATPPTNGTPSGPTAGVVTLSATDTGSGVASISYRIYKKGTTAGTFTVVLGASALVTVPVGAGVYRLDYYSTDAVGNHTATKSFQVVVLALGVRGASSDGMRLGVTLLPLLAVGALGLRRRTRRGSWGTAR